MSVFVTTKQGWLFYTSQRNIQRQIQNDDAEVQGAHVTGVRGEEEAETNRSL